MSWCRWSTDIDGKCNSDLYIYDNVHGYITVHVAGRRRSNYADNPHKEPSWESDTNHDEAWIQNYIKQGELRSDWFDEHDEWEPIPEAYAGKNYDFNYDDLNSLTEFLKQARIDGINFPDYLFDYIKEYHEDIPDQTS